MKKQEFLEGLRDGLPICLGYFSVSMAFGLTAVMSGVPIWAAVMISLTNLTSAGQFAGVTLIVACAGLWELILTQLVINCRYALMSLALSQRLGNKIGFFSRLAIAFFNTDEIFAIAMAEKQPLTTPFLLGLGMLPYLGWVGGTLLGGLAGSVLPLMIRTALGVMLYGMFVAIVIPPARKERPVLVAVVAAVILSSMFTWVPVLKEISSGVAIVICTVAAAALCAVLFPIPDEEAAK